MGASVPERIPRSMAAPWIQRPPFALRIAAHEPAHYALGQSLVRAERHQIHRQVAAGQRNFGRLSRVTCNQCPRRPATAARGGYH